MTLDKDRGTKKYLFGLIELGPREKEAKVVRYPWLTWLFIVVAVLVVAGAIAFAIINKISFF
ncbi:hypothetical protein BH11ACT2_BH11ACT2_22770 [soil metagenome]